MGEIVAGEHVCCLVLKEAINIAFLRAFVMLCKKHNHVLKLTERERNAGISGSGYRLPIQG